MNLPFTTEQFLEVFEKYNLSVFPAQIVLFILALTVTVLAFVKFRSAGVFTSAVLAAFWIWMGTVYHILFFAAINKPAYFFGALFIFQGILFIYEGILKKNLSFEFKFSFYSVTGLVFIVYALVIYPVLGYMSGHIYPKSPTFGLPCPTTIFTLGVLLLAVSRVRPYILAVPFIWSLIGATAAFKLGIIEDLGLLAAGVLTVVFILIRNRGISSTS
jgi:hypothetical protein